jgi:hypothetical protein
MTQDLRKYGVRMPMADPQALDEPKGAAGRGTG